MPEGIFIFGGYPWSKSSWEWLPSGTNQWQSGDTIIQNGFWTGCAVKINETDILLIGGYSSRHRVLKFDTITKNFTNLGDVLNEGRYKGSGMENRSKQTSDCAKSVGRED